MPKKCCGKWKKKGKYCSNCPIPKEERVGKVKKDKKKKDKKKTKKK
jgi:hypothetical protein